jgi:micrococcal nuclease
MENMKRKIFPFLTLILLVPCFVPVVLAGEIDATTVVDWVIDGDTFDTTSGDRVRLADIDAPEYGEPGYYDAKNFLISLVYGKTVYLDIDDIYETDKYGRLVCVVYVKSSSTHYKNVNKALLVEGVAVIKNYHNEFDPYTWTLYVDNDSIPEFPSFLILSLFIVATLLATIVYQTKHT